MRKALFVGSFDPLTKGHLDIIERASQLTDQLYVGILTNNSKQPLLSLEQRQILLSASLKHLDNINIITHHKQLTATVAQELGIQTLIRSIRDSRDLAYEEELMTYNRELAGLETLLLISKPEFKHISSSRVKELLHFGASIAPYTPKVVAELLEGSSNATN